MTSSGARQPTIISRMPDAPIDLRSDTVTRPTPEMRAAMASADVGDDVYGDDPTVRRLEERAAELTGKEAALFVPSGCMGNLISIMAQAPAGSEILVADNSHIHCAEGGGYARLAQVNKWALPTDKFGRMDAARLEQAIHIGYGRPGGNSHLPTTALLCLENTHNFCGGTVLSIADLRMMADAARSKAPWIKVHLDGARVFNAAVALNVPVRQLADVADTVSFCLSKGLCAPVGALVCGTREFVTQAHALRKMLGGGMRQAGVLAACGLISLSDGMVNRLADDHANARRLAAGLSGLKGIRIDFDTVQTNILFIEPTHPGRDAAWLVAGLEAQGVRCLVLGTRVRMVTHRDVSRAQIDSVLTIARGLLG